MPGRSISQESVAHFSRRTFEDILDYNRKFLKAVELLYTMRDKVSVGTTPSEIIYHDGTMNLLKYKPFVEEEFEIPLLIIYALVNKPYILDLQPDRSVVRSLLSAGIRVYLIDWGTPTDADKYLKIDDYINGYIDDVVDFIRDRENVDKISIMGYCMGGTFAVMYSALYPEKVKNLVLMAAPISFTGNSGLLEKWSAKNNLNVDKLVDTFGNVPPEFLNTGFLFLDPIRNLYEKYVEFVDGVDDIEFALTFVRMEKWISDGIPVPKEVFREFIKYGYQENRLINNKWEINGKTVDLRKINMPVLSIVANKDHIVPPEESLPLHKVIRSKDQKILYSPGGHIGLSVGKKAHRELWPKVAGWLKERSKLKNKIKKKHHK